MIHAGETVHIPFAHRPAAPIDPADVAAVAADALTTLGHRGTAYQLSGPEVLTPTGELDILAEALGRSLHLAEPTPQQIRKGMRRGGMPEPVIEAILTRARTADTGTEVLPTVTEILGRPPAGFAQWATAHSAAFTSPTPRRAVAHTPTT
jgi:uncharacterized protein YbjT (DUF2867 family)